MESIAAISFAILAPLAGFVVGRLWRRDYYRRLERLADYENKKATLSRKQIRKVHREERRRVTAKRGNLKRVK